MLAADQLQRAVERHEYAEAAHLVEAVQQLSMHFQSFAQIPKVAELAGRVATLQRSLHMNVMREFELLGTGEESTNPLLLERLKACCLVTDALGYKVGAALPASSGFRLAHNGCKPDDCSCFSAGTVLSRRPYAVLYDSAEA